jgi:hypothetical protein
MSEPKPINHAELARHWGCSAPYVSKLVKTKAMPAFVSLAEADAWRSVNAPARHSAKTAPQDSNKNGIEGEKNIALDPNTTTATGTTPAAETANAPKCSAPNTVSGGGEIIDVTCYITRGVDFDELMLRQAEDAAQVAHGLYLRACAGGNPTAISAALKNRTDAADAAAAVRKRFLEIQEQARSLISIDEVMDTLGTELQAWRAAMLKLGERCANVANPADPALAKRAIDAGVDQAFQKLESAIDRGQAQLAAQKAS